MDVQTESVNALARKHKNQKKALIAILQDIQAEYNYLPQEALQQVGRSLGVPLIDVIGVATFYRTFSLKPRGRHVITVCLGTACHVRGGPKILEEFERQASASPPETPPDDGQFHARNRRLPRLLRHRPGRGRRRRLSRPDLDPQGRDHHQTVHEQVRRA